MLRDKGSRRQFKPKFEKTQMVKVIATGFVGKVTAIQNYGATFWYTLDQREGPFAQTELKACR